MIWDFGKFGDATNRTGVYATVATLQFLMKWVEETFRPWFETYCCPS